MKHEDVDNGKLYTYEIYFAEGKWLTCEKKKSCLVFTDTGFIIWFIKCKFY